MKKIASTLFALTLPIFATIPVSAESLRPLRWASPHYADHPLVGSVWHGNGKPSDWNELSGQIAQAHFVLVGETHTNVDHHVVQAGVLDLLAKRSRQPTVVWEMIPENQESLLRSAKLRTADDVRALGTNLNWASSGWPAWSMYQPIALAAVQHGLAMRGAGLPRQYLRTLARTSGADLSIADRRRLHLTYPLSDAHSESMTQVLFEGHCELMAKSTLAPMQLVQRARDGAMAQAMIMGSTAANADSGADQRRNGVHGAVLIAGNGHIRKDWAVPAILSRSRPELTRLSIAQVEVHQDAKSSSEYPELTTGNGLYDYVIFTPRSEIRDHCADLRKRFKQ